MRLDKLHLWAIISVAAAVFAFAQAVSGAEISRHTRQDTGIRAALDWCTAKGGQLSWVEKAPYVLSDDGATATLTGNVLVFTCKTTTASVPSWLITWNPPTTRENGTALPAAQIAGYQITIGGRATMVSGTSYTATLPRGTVIELRTVDTSMPALMSAPAMFTL